MLDEHNVQNTHQKTCIDCGRTWHCRGCFHKSPNGLCRYCREIQKDIIAMEEARLDSTAPFLYLK